MSSRGSARAAQTSHPRRPGDPSVIESPRAATAMEGPPNGAIIDVRALKRRGVPPDDHTTGHDIVVVGASAGGVEALRKITARLPADLPASVFVVLHVPAIATSVLPAILERAGDLPSAHAEDGAEIERRSEEHTSELQSRRDLVCRL